MGKNEKKKGIYEKNKTRKNIIIIIFSLIVFWYLFGPVYTSPNVDEQSEWYVNDIYMSDGRIYNDFLNEKEKKMYMFLLNNTKKFQSVHDLDMDEAGCKDYN